MNPRRRDGAFKKAAMIRLEDWISPTLRVDVCTRGRLTDLTDDRKISIRMESCNAIERAHACIGESSLICFEAEISAQLESMQKK